MPFIPNIIFSVNKAFASNDGFVYQTALANENDNESLKEIPNDNRLVIPKIGVDGEIFPGAKDSLEKGLWLRPNTSTPREGGNTVIVAHRFLYSTGPITFYHLDKLNIGDKFSVYWEEEEYVYEIFDVFEVDPTDVYIEDQDEENIVTLYTCTPLYTADKRLVVRARLV
jgi:sortase A